VRKRNKLFGLIHGEDSNCFPLDVGKGRWFHGKGRI
jgi:hypothetical protein